MEPQPLLSSPPAFDDFEFSVRITNCLRNTGIDTLEELLKWPERWLLYIPNFGRGSLNELKGHLARYGLELPGYDGNSNDSYFLSRLKTWRTYIPSVADKAKERVSFFPNPPLPTNSAERVELRRRYALCAMHAMLSHNLKPFSLVGEICRKSFEYADEMLKIEERL